MRLTLLTTEHASVVQEVIESQSTYTERISGSAPGEHDGEELFAIGPHGIDAKLVYGAWQRDRLVGVVDVLLGYPRKHVAFIGLLMVHGAVGRGGYGRRIHEAVIDAVQVRDPDADTLRLAVVDTNADQAAPFWRALGYEPTGEVKPYSNGTVESVARLWERPLVMPDHPAKSG